MMLSNVLLLIFTTLFPILAYAISIDTPSGWVAGETATVKWSSSDSDKIFSIELANPDVDPLSNGPIAIANNVSPSQRSETVSVPEVPAGSGYTLMFVNVIDITEVYATSGSFSICAAGSSSCKSSDAQGGSSSKSATSKPASSSSLKSAPSSTGTETTVTSNTSSVSSTVTTTPTVITVPTTEVLSITVSGTLSVTSLTTVAKTTSTGTVSAPATPTAGAASSIRYSIGGWGVAIGLAMGLCLM